MQELFIPFTFPSLNEVFDKCKSNFHMYAKIKRTLTRDVAMCCKEQKIQPMESCALWCIWHEKNQRRDPDNVFSAVKFILDGLVSAGVLTDDRWKQVKGMTHTLEIRPDKPGVLVRLCNDLTDGFFCDSGSDT